LPTVGDVITRVRSVANDPCQTLGQPVAPNLAISAIAGIFNGHVFGAITYLNTWGETVSSTEVDLAALANQALDLSAMVPPYGATQGRFYFGYASGQEQQFVSFVPGVAATVGIATDVPLSGVPPYKSSAFLPDTDGDLVDASALYRWINAGLVQLGRLAGGILDQTGVAMAAGSAEVEIPGWWLNIKYVWHNGWQLIVEQQSYTWLQSPVGGIPGIVTLWKNAAKQVFGTWPQPSTSPALTLLTSAMGVKDNVANVQNTADFHGTDGAIATGSQILNSPNGGFSASMVGLNITTIGAGPAGGNLITTVQSFISANQIQTTAAAATTVVGAVFDITGSGAPGFTAPGMCQIDSEIMSYSQASATQLTGLVRGYSGTIPAAHAQNATVSQLIFRLLGRRMPVQVAVGQSANTLDLPQGWDTVLDYYLLSYFKRTEQDDDAADKLAAKFEAKAIELRDDQIPLENKQIGALWPIGGAAESLAEIQDSVIVQ
jgi:hypothetical protein